MRFVDAVANRTARPCCVLAFRLCSWLLVGILASSSFVFAQAPDNDQQNPQSAPANPQPHFGDVTLPPVQLKSLPRNLFVDQKNFWTTPFHMTPSQWQWTVPLAFVSAGLLASDTAIEKHAPTSHTTTSHAVTVSNVGVAALAGVGAGMYLWGYGRNNDEQRETGLLAGEAGIDALIDTEAFKYIFGRERPFTGDGKGNFFQGGNSFPSQHAAISWAIASVISHEYPGALTQILAYGAATGVTAARFAGQQHFFTDLVAGSALGWYLGRQVYRTHSRYSNAEIAKWGTFSKSEKEDTGHEPRNMGSPFVPLDSWIYPAMERLIAAGYIQSDFLGMRPWTRMECARLLLKEANEQLQAEEETGTADKLYAALSKEFKAEIERLGGETNLGANLDSIYTRFMDISGRPLQDGFHFGQTIINDYGRPYSEGFNNVTGISGDAVAGPLSVYVRGEYQHAPSIPALSLSAAQFIQRVDGSPSAPPSTPTAAVDQFQLLEGYVGMQLDNWQFSFGKQALWWGADQSGPMLFSTNAEPILMLQINRVTPFKLPLLGNLRIDYMVGRLTGYHWVNGPSGFVGSWTQSLSDQPFIVGEKLSLKPTSNLELGFSATALFGGPGVPATAHKLLKAMFSTSNGPPGTSSDPGDRRGGFDFAYTIPRAGVTFYADAFTDDEPNPWLSWNKSAVTSGIYLSRVPGIPNLDLRAEGVYTDPPGGSATVQKGFFYDNSRFRSGYTNNGYLIGSWIGRQGQGADAWATYWLSPKSKVQFNFRHQKVSDQFVQYGGTLTDFGISADYWLRSNIGISAWVQRERWLFPIIQPNASNNTTAAVQITFGPQKLFQRAHSGANPP